MISPLLLPSSDTAALQQLLHLLRQRRLPLSPCSLFDTEQRAGLVTTGPADRHAGDLQCDRNLNVWSLAYTQSGLTTTLPKPHRINSVEAKRPECFFRPSFDYELCKAGPASKPSARGNCLSLARHHLQPKLDGRTTVCCLSFRHFAVHPFDCPAAKQAPPLKLGEPTSKNCCQEVNRANQACRPAEQ